MENKFGFSFNAFYTDKNGVGGISIPLEDSDSLSCQSYTPTPTNLITPATICEYSNSNEYCVGETLFSDMIRLQMYAGSGIFKSSGKSNRIKRKDHVRERVICEGVIQACRKIPYMNCSAKENLYEIVTIGADRCEYRFEISHNEFEQNLMSVLTKEGRLIFHKYRHFKNDGELVYAYLVALARETDTTYPYFPRWHNGRYLCAKFEHNAPTPFFQNIICIDEALPIQVSFKEVLKILKIFKKPICRLFFLILSSYTILQSAFPESLRIDVPFAINIEKKFGKIPVKLLDIFSGSTPAICDICDNRKNIDTLKNNRLGTIMFLSNDSGSNNYYRKKALSNMSYIAANQEANSVTVIVNKDHAGYVEGAFNISIHTLDAIAIPKINEMKKYLAHFLLDFAEWISKQGVNLIDICQTFLCEDNVETVFKTIFTLIDRYNDTILEVPLAEKLGFADNSEVMSEIENLCAEKDSFKGGEWILERLGDILRMLYSEQKCQKFLLKKGVNVTFDNEKITLIEKSDLLCISEEDMKKLVDNRLSELSLENVKESLLRYDALECDKGQTYLKNIYIPNLNKAKRLLAIKKDVLKHIGDIEL